MGKIANTFSNTLALIIKVYRFLLSPLLGNCCRFSPSCSTYAIESLYRHGSLRGCFFIFKRILRCHPWHPGGFDPVPEKINHAN